MAALRSDEEISAFEEEVKDRFGPLPPPLEHLFLHAKSKALCQRAKVAKLFAGSSDAAWSEGRFILPCEVGLEEQTGCAIRFLNQVIELTA
ncbi:MAG: hypothetical protein FD144_5584 [Rhodospirillaceae bacterium]|nr:MAG: hypothetical protein FD144_5584 [Rhodospirillaceae bacterium]